MSALPLSRSTRRQALGVLLLASAVLLLAAIRASMGLSFYDDSYYIVIPLRFAHGARIFVDEFSLQSLGELVSVPFVRLYETFFGLTGVALFVRELYVVLAAFAGVVVYRLLRRRAQPAAAAIAAILPLLALPYHLFAPTYNTVAQLCFTLAVVLAWSSLRGARCGSAAASGVLLALGVVSHPALAPAALVLLLTFVAMARKRPPILAALSGAVLTAAVAAVAMTLGPSAADLRRALAFESANVGGIGLPLDKLAWALGQLGHALASPWLWPMWALAVVASLPLLPGRLRAVTLASIPVAAVVPGVVLLARGDGFSFGTATSSWLITVTCGIALPAVVWAWSAGKSDFLRLMALATPFAITGFVTIAYVTNSSWNRGTGSIALAPLTTALLLCWATAIAEGWGYPLQWVAIVAALLVAFGLLYANIFSDPLTLTSHVLVTEGPYAGITTSVGRSDQLRALEGAGRRWVEPKTRVTFLGEREAYLAVGGVWDTPAVWLPPAPSDRAAIDYYQRQGEPAQVVFVDEIAIAREGGYQGGRASDPFLSYVLERYHRVASVADFGVFVRN